MKQFQIQLFKGHPIINDGENIILVDTGSPVTINLSDSLSFCSDIYNCSNNYMGLSISQISEMLGMKITTLLGIDILSKYKILIDYQNLQMIFNKSDIDIDGTSVNISNFMGIPIIEMNINNLPLKFFLDTGAKLSYLSEDFTRNFDSIGVEEDFYPGFGNFQTNCFEIPTYFDNNKFNVKYGNLPPLLKMTLMLGGVDGILGFDFFNNFTVVLDLNNNKMKYIKN